MKKYIILIAAVITAAITVISGITAPAKKMTCPKCYVMHPEITTLDEAGNRTLNRDSISLERTCGECHNTAFIEKHNSHYNDRAKIGCAACHVEGGEIPLGPTDINPDGSIKKDRIRIRVPSDENCLRCHGAGGTRGKAVYIPENYPGSPYYTTGERYFDLTWKTGEILSPDNISESQLNLKGKTGMVYPWDVHLQREVACVSCHFTRNDPRRNETRASDQEHLANDPRKSYLIGKYLYIPDHNLVHADCRTCHLPEKKHDFLPYKERHFAVLSCQSCHVPRLYGPAVKTVDETVVMPDSNPRFEFRGTGTWSGSNLNTAYSTGYEPFLLSHERDKNVMKQVTGIKDGISPVNIVTRWRWTDSGGNPVPYGIVKKAYMDGSDYNPDVVKVFDSNHDGVMDSSELMLDTQVKTDFISSRLTALGISSPVISAVTEEYRVNHGVAHEKTIKSDCLMCHSGKSRFDATVELSSFVPAGGKVIAGKSASMGGLLFYLNGKIKNGKKELELVKDGRVKNRYIFGYSSVTWLNVLGVIIFILSAAGAAGHGILRYFAGKGSGQHNVRLVRVHVYALYQRVWHWCMALSVVVLILTGLEIHFSGSFNLMGFDSAVDVHNFFALLVALNAALSLFYHVATGEIKQYFSMKKGFKGEVIVQAAYYLYGIFRGDGHPFEKTRERRLNPLQQITYVMLLNVLFPVQIVTGIMMWAVSLSPAFSSAVGGLTVIAPVHNFFAWLFISFLAVHLYLITTGHTLSSNLMAMITGIEEVEEPGAAEKAREGLGSIKPADIILNIRRLISGRG